MADIIQLRRDTAANWASVNPTLAHGELGWETDTGKTKMGDAVLAWNSLPYGGIVGPAGPAGADGATGATGPTGAAGVGVPTGGTTGQVLAKVSGTNYDTNWVDQTGGGGAFYNIPNVTKNSNYTLIASDKGTVLTKTDTTARTYTVNNSVFNAGDFVGFNNAASTALINLTIGAGLTVYFAGSTLTGSRAIAPRGFGWLYFRTASEAYLTGGGVG